MAIIILPQGMGRIKPEDHPKYALPWARILEALEAVESVVQDLNTRDLIRMRVWVECCEECPNIECPLDAVDCTCDLYETRLEEELRRVSHGVSRIRHQAM